VTQDRLRIGIVGSGDVAHRHYLPTLAAEAERVSIAAFADPREGAAEVAADAVSSWSQAALAYRDVATMLAAGGLDAVFNLTPAPLLGDEQPVLTAEHARHVLDVALKAHDSMADGRAHETDTSFETPSGWGGPATSRPQTASLPQAGSTTVGR
jgi:hypothetical protein